MRVLERREIKLQLSDLAIQARILFEKGFPEPKPRRSGIHVSGILRHIAFQPGMESLFKNGQVQAEDFEEEFPLRMFIGMCFEMGAQAVWPDMVWQPGAVEKDGILGSPDGLTPEFEMRNDVYGPVVRTVRLLEEFKFTWKSSRNRHNSITGEWLWVRQLMSYCYMMGLRYARLHVLWSNGQWDWKTTGGFSPTYNTYLIEFTEADLEKNWQMLLAHKDKAIAEVH